ncbi:3-dehydroquinate synthase [Candidatus Sumerlaeota bacterium]|nr:3-dehydroquinate synthase [Candidatus Sumerlaeota bacterium]
MTKLRVELGERSYFIVIGSNILKNLGKVLRQIHKHDRVVVVTTHPIGKHYDQEVHATLAEAEFLPEVFALPDGEPFKNHDTLMSIYNFLIDYHYDRQTLLLALGGGVVGDITGFAAATFMRGIPYVQVPTSLLAMVDSSVGGKTGVNHPHGKNMIGAFHQPILVFIDFSTLDTLPDAEFRAGFAEVIKYGVIWSGEFFDYCRVNLARIMEKDSSCMLEIIRRSCEIKAEVVRQDERESGIRAILNYGHTFGHALEAITKYEHFKHGEAVALGMIIGARLSQRLEMLPADQANAIETLIKDSGLPVRFPAHIDPEDIWDRMRRDKKVHNGKLRLVLPVRIGRIEIRDDVDKAPIMATLRETREAQ